MSIRPEISGFSLPKLIALSGCKDAAVAHALEVEESEKFGNPEVSGVIRRYIMEGSPFPDVFVESYIHVCAAQLLAGFDQRHAATDSNFFALQDLLEMPTKRRTQANPEVNALFTFLAEGRPLFGQRSNGDTIYYSYLTHAELGQLLQYVKQPKVKSTKLWDPEYMDNLLSRGHISQWEYDQERRGLADTAMMTFEKAFAMWCKDFYDTGQDLWLFCV